MSPGLDPSLFDEADAYRRAAEEPKPPPLDGVSLQRQAATEANLLFRQAAEVLRKAGVPTISFYRPGFLIGVADAGEGWDLRELQLTAAGSAHARHGGSDMYYQSSEYRAAVRRYKTSGRSFMRLGGLLTVGTPRSVGGHNGLLTATDEGRVEIFYDSYDYRWTLLEDWLSEAVRQLLRR